MSTVRRFLQRRPKTVLAAGIMTIVIGTGLAAAASFGASATGLVSCGTNSAVNLVAEFSVPDGPSVFTHLPLLEKTPELSDPSGPLNKGPLQVSVFAGDVCGVPAIGAYLPNGDASPVFHNVVRITRPDGDAWYFSGVDLSQIVP